MHDVSDPVVMLERAEADCAFLREWILLNHGDNEILAVTDGGREILDRLYLAEDTSNESLVDGLFELRDSLKKALSLLTVNAKTAGTYYALKEVLLRWGEIHLRVIAKGNEHERQDRGSGKSRRGNRSQGKLLEEEA